MTNKNDTPNFDAQFKTRRSFDPDIKLQEATALFRNGELEKAEALYRDILKNDPHNPDALHLLGLLAGQLGFREEGVSLIESALEISPENPLFLDNASIAYNQLGLSKKEEKVLRKSLRVDNNNADSLNNLASLLTETAEGAGGAKKFNEAKKLLEKAIQLSPENAGFVANLGNVFKKNKELDVAKTYYNRALELDSKLSGALNNLGVIAHVEAELDEAISYFQRALSIDPDDAKAHNNLAEVYAKQRKLDEAIEQFKKAINLTEDNALIYYNMGNALQRRGLYYEAIDALLLSMELNPDNHRAFCLYSEIFLKLDLLDEAEQFLTNLVENFPGDTDFLVGQSILARLQFDFERAEELLREVLKREPFHAAALQNLGVVLYTMGRLDESIEAYNKALKAYPGLPDARFNYSFVLFSSGKLKEGWEHLESRWECDMFSSPVRAFPQPQWDGSSLEGKSILLWGEQGLGDELRYASMVPEMLNRGAKVSIECEERLVDLFARSFEGAKVFPRPYLEAETGKIDYDFQCPILSLGKYLRPTVDTFPKAPHNFLKPNLDRQKFWKERFAELGPRPKIGIVWRSMLRSSGRNIHYVTIKELEPVLTLPGVDFINLQYDECSEELAEAADLFGVKIHEWDDIDLKEELDDVAAFISSLDLVISYSSSSADLASNVGTPVLEFLSVESHALMLGTGNSVWSPGITMYTKKPKEPWDRVLNEIAQTTRQKFGLDG